VKVTGGDYHVRARNGYVDLTSASR